MRISFLIITLITFLIACNSPQGEQAHTDVADSGDNHSTQIDESSKSNAPQIDLTIGDMKFTVWDSSNYSSDFISKLKESQGMSSIELRNDVLIMNAQDSIPFPSEIKVGESKILQAEDGNGLAIKLKIARINQSSLQYTISNSKDGEIQTGRADLSPYFYLASEIDENTETGMSYTSTEYSGSGEACDISIRLGQEDENPALLGKLILSCKDDALNIDLEDFPTLQEK